MSNEISAFHFTDEKGDVWDVKVTGGTHKRVKKLLGINILDILNIKTPSGERFVGDVGFQVDVLWAVCQPKAIERNVSEEEFAERLAGDAFWSAVDALMEGAINFIPNPTARANMRKLWQMMKQEGEKAEAEITATVNNPETRIEIAGMVKKRIDYLSTAAESSGSSPTE